MAGRDSFVFWRDFRLLYASLSTSIPRESMVTVTLVSFTIPFGVVSTGLASCVVDTVQATLSTGLAAITSLVEDAV
jgi:hypothetical protein